MDLYGHIHIWVGLNLYAVQKSQSSYVSNSSTWTPPKSAKRKSLFNRIAPVYDNLNDRLSLGQHRIWKRMALTWSGVKGGDHVLDLCCGSGDLAFLLAEKIGLHGKVTGLDFAEEQLLMAFHRQKYSPVPSHQIIEWIHGDALNLPFLDASFDAITMGYGLRNITDIPLSLHEIYRVLKKGCKASILDFNHPIDPSIFALQEWILDNIVVPAATQFGLQDEYAYLKTSITQFPTGKEQEMLADEAGFSHARHFEIAGGFMGVLVVQK